MLGKTHSKLRPFDAVDGPSSKPKAVENIIFVMLKLCNAADMIGVLSDTVIPHNAKTTNAKTWKPNPGEKMQKQNTFPHHIRSGVVHGAGVCVVPVAFERSVTPAMVFIYWKKWL